MCYIGCGNEGDMCDKCHVGVSTGSFIWCGKEGDTCDKCHVAVTSEHVSPGVALKVTHLTGIVWL